MKLRSAPTLMLWAGLAVASLLGWLAPLDNALRDLRFVASQRQPTGSVVFVEVDSKSLQAFGVWPWPRQIEADIIDKLGELGAAEIALDIDLSVPSNDADDAALEAALDRAGGYAIMVAFGQPLSGGRSTFNLPLPRFAAHAPVAAADVPLDGGGVVRAYPYAMQLAGTTYTSMAATLAGREAPPGTGFVIDWGIDLHHVDRISAVDLLNGTIDPARITDKQVIVGASAVELRDIFNVPRYGMVPGAMLHLAATETLKQNRALMPLGEWPVLAGMVLIGLLGLVIGPRLARPRHIAIAVTSAVLVELLALGLQIGPGKLLDTAALHLTAIVIVVRAIWLEAELRRRLQAEAASERDGMRRILDRVIADNFEGVVVVEGDTVLAASRLAAELLGRDLLGQKLSALPRDIEVAIRRALELGDSVGTVEPAEVELDCARGDRRIIEYAVTRSLIENAKSKAQRRVACLTFRDVTARRQSEARLSYLATHDPLTGALTRFRFTELLATKLADVDRAAAGLTVFLVDLSRFKAVNDTLGHVYGDMLLREAVDRLRLLGFEDVARVGGDSFAVVTEPALRPDAIPVLAGKLMRALVAPYELAGHRAVIGASLGITTTQLSGPVPELLLSHADMAQTQAKEQSGNSFVVFSPEFDRHMKESRTLELALRQAIEAGALSMHYQPQVTLTDGRLFGAEALIRWKDPELGSVSPARFIPVAEETGLIVDLGRWILETACREAATWPAHLRIAINVSPVQFELSDVYADVCAALDKTGLDPSRLDIEITEGVLVSNGAAVMQVLERLRDLGIGVAIDDFGTGYSSLSYLGRLPVDKIKIDQSFVRNLPDDTEAEAIVRAVMALASSLGKLVVAEGVETADQASMLRGLGCQIGQGYHYARPLDADTFQQKMLAAEPAVRTALAV